MLFAHGALFLLRTPLGVMLHLSPNSDYSMSGWLGLLSLEALLFTISIAFILVAMAKEHTELRHRTAARTDELTGIANRRGFLEQAVASMRSANSAESVAVLLFDLDKFKPINDQFGHGIGDRVLQIFADTAKAQIGPSGIVGRWGGDEFVAVIYDTPSDRAATLAERIQVAFEKATGDIDGRPACATVSTGMVFSSAGAIDLPSLLVQADKALYRAKEKGRNRLEVSAAEATAMDDSEQDAGRAKLMRRDAA
jgi:diguanylate cyclase (GGDEF)-like protein